MNLIWFRNDLRIHANPALQAAVESGEPCVAVVCLTPKSWDEHSEGSRRMAFWRARLEVLQQELEQLNVPLKVLQLSHFTDCADALIGVAERIGVSRLLFNYEYPLNEKRRDESVKQAFSAAGLAVSGYHGELIIPPGEVKTGQGTDFKVYTPFSRAWRKRLQAFDRPIKALTQLAPESGIASDLIPTDLGWQPLGHDTERWPVDSESIRKRVYLFVEERERDYAELRNFPAVDGTSMLSPYLTIGAVSPLQLMHVLRAQYSDDGWLEGSWLNEIIWREFYRHLLVAFPQLNMLKPFRPETEARITWRDDQAGFEAWCKGETGYPIVDAAMKQMLETGWMHNRLRMIVGSFLTKLLGVDWRLGERFFMEQLIDADFASNLGGWQWSSSTGADAAPYFRIFNPITQSQKFDADGEFLVRWLPELRAVAPKQRHLPGAGSALGRPLPIIDYANSRKRALDSYNSAGQ